MISHKSSLHSMPARITNDSVRSGLGIVIVPSHFDVALFSGLRTVLVGDIHVSSLLHARLSNRERVFFSQSCACSARCQDKVVGGRLCSPS